MLSPLLFTPVMELISRTTNPGEAGQKLMYADYLALVADIKEKWVNMVSRWASALEDHDLKVTQRKLKLYK